MKALLVLLLASSFSAQAQFLDRCVPKEYAQYKDSTKSAMGLMDISFDACRHEKIASGQLAKPPAKVACEAEIQKAKDALAGKPKWLAFIRGGCNGTPPY